MRAAQRRTGTATDVLNLMNVKLLFSLFSACCFFTLPGFKMTGILCLLSFVFFNDHLRAAVNLWPFSFCICVILLIFETVERCIKI